jgi:hypothetical protein
MAYARKAGSAPLETDCVPADSLQVIGVQALLVSVWLHVTMLAAIRKVSTTVGCYGSMLQHACSNLSDSSEYYVRPQVPLLSLYGCQNSTHRYCIGVLLSAQGCEHSCESPAYCCLLQARIGLLLRVCMLAPQHILCGSDYMC